MNKGNILTFAISLVVLITIIVVVLIFLLPQPSAVLEASMVKYETIKKSDYVYEQTKDLTRDALVKEYSITSEQMDKFKNNNQYVSGNSDPFTPAGSHNDDDDDSTNSTNSDNRNNTSTTNKNNSTSSSTNNSSNSNTSVSEDTTQKITNSNGGQANPPSTNK